MQNKIRLAEQRARQYWFVDGLAEQAAGLVSVFLAVLLWVWERMFTWQWSLPLVMVTGLVFSFGLRLIIQRIKERSTYPRTGYVAPLTGFEQKRSVLLVVAFILLLLGLNYVVSTSGSQALQWTPALAGLVYAFLFAWTGAVLNLRRFFLLAGISALLGLAVLILNLGYLQGVGVLSGVVGTVLLYQGTRVRRAYLAHHQMEDTSADA